MTDRHEISKRLRDEADDREEGMRHEQPSTRELVALMREAADALDSSPLLPEGWVAVPREVTEELVRIAESGQNHDEGAFDEDCEVCQTLSRVRAALSTAPAPPSPWREIASAPKDGTTILLAYSDGGVVEGRYIDNTSKGYPWAGFIARSMYPQKPGVHVTHWMPLPPAPEVKGS